MNHLLFIETFVLGSTTIAAIYHLVLFIQQRDKFLIYYSGYLFSLAIYISFKLISDNYDPFLPTDNMWYYILEEVIQVSISVVYVLFASQTLDVVKAKSIPRTLTHGFYIFSALSIVAHISGPFFNDVTVKSIHAYSISRASLIGTAYIALLFVWRIRTTIFQRTIIIGSFVYATSGLLSVISFIRQEPVFGLSGVEPYLVGCIFDIIIFSSALGYRLKLIALEKNELLKKELESQLAMEKVRLGIASNLHDDLGSTLSSISIYSEAVKNSLQQNKTEQVLELIDKIGSSARDTVSNMSDIVWAINPLNDNGIKLFNRMESFASPILNSKNIFLKFNVEEELKSFNFKMPVRQNLFLIFKEIIINAAKYSEAKNISVQFSKTNSSIIMKIMDDGIGFDKNIATAGNGLRNIHARAKELSGAIEINSTQNGTSAKLLFHADQS